MQMQQVQAAAEAQWAADWEARCSAEYIAEQLDECAEDAQIERMGNPVNIGSLCEQSCTFADDRSIKLTTIQRWEREGLEPTPAQALAILGLSSSKDQIWQALQVLRQHWTLLDAEQIQERADELASERGLSGVVL